MERNGSLAGAVTVAFAAVTMALFATFSVAAQPPLPGVGVLTPGPAWKPVVDGLREGLGKLGYRDGINVRFMVEDSNRDFPGLASWAATLAEAKPDVLFAVTTPHAMAAKRATSTTPIVFVSVGAPVEAGLVASFASSRNNLTGISSYAAFLSGKRLELLKEIAPKTKKILIIVSGKEIISQISAQHSEEAARKIGIQILRRDAANTEDAEKLLLDRWGGIVDAVFPLPSALTGTYIEQMIKKANKERMPLIVYEETLVKMGALASYGSNRSLIGIQAAKLVARVLKGTRPADIPIEVPDRFTLAINLTTAKNIGLEIPRKVSERADRLLE